MFDINELYNLMFKDIVTPFNLLENAKLDNYKYVKYYTKKEYFITEMKCSLGNNDERVFYYYFENETNKLQKIYQKCSVGKKELLFDRVQEIEKLKSKLNVNDKKLVG